MKTDELSPNGSLNLSPPDRGAVSLKHRAYAELKSRILSGALPPGTLLSERQLAQNLKMSKTPVHAALERLEGDGLVTVAAQQGIIVRAISPHDILDHFEIREALEPFVVSRLAGQLTAEQAGLLERNLADNRRAVREGDSVENIRLDSEFHLLLCEFHGNKEITRAMGHIRDKIHGVIHHITTRCPERVKASLSEHEAIVSALLAGDALAATEQIKTHLRNGLESIYQRHP
jgi:DNA-binding GntR family transcriptional regulator